MTWGSNGLASRRTISINSSVFSSFDVQGNTALRLNANGNRVGSYGFDAYGTRASTDNSTDPYSGYGAQWGYYRDAETGLSLLGHRYYDPGQGRFLNRDPIGYDGGLNLYAYVGSNPAAAVDPDGFSLAHPHNYIDGIGTATAESPWGFINSTFGITCGIGGHPDYDPQNHVWNIHDGWLMHIIGPWYPAI